MAHGQQLHDHDRGLSHDLPTLLSRRRALTLLGGAGLAAALAGCGITGSDDGAGGSPMTSSAAGATSAGTEIPEETAGPYPGDGSSGVNVLTESGIVRSDITSSFGSATGVAQGVPLTIKLKVLDTGNGSAGLQGAAVYLWHCDRDGRYSLYSEGITQENYLRGVQETGSDGSVQFTSIYPAAYSGRWPHIHFEVYPSLAKATSPSNKIATSQIAIPKEICDTVYATDGYGQSVAALARVSLASDGVFGDDGGAHQLGTVSGSVAGGLTVELAVPVKAA